jgi:selenoprotein W-related protein
LLKTFEPEIETLTLVPSTGGRFEISVNGRLLYSKLETQRHPERNEVLRMVQNFLREGKS